MHSLRKLDIFPKFDSKFEQDAREKTVIGAFFSIFALILISFLVFSEVNYFFSVHERHELFVDTDVGGDLDITVNVTFPNVPCDLITIDAVDSFGEFQENLDKTTVKHRVDGTSLALISEVPHLVDGKKVATVPLDSNGNKKADCESCYGAELVPGQCCNSCQDVQKAYQVRGWHFELNDISIVQCAKQRLQHATALAQHEGCNVFSRFKVSRVQGNIHFIPGKAFQIMGQHLHDLGGDEVSKLNLSHVFHTLQFGAQFPGQKNPLDNRDNIITNGDDDASSESGKAEGHHAKRIVAVNGKFSYFVKVVPTVYETQRTLASNSVVETNQYSVTEHYQERPAASGNGLMMMQQFIPGLFIIYDLSPIKVRIFEAHPYPSLAHFLLQLCAICGGVFTVMGLLDAFLHHGVIQVKRKLAMGKQS